MKIEMGESLLQSYLKCEKGCLLTQTNWKTSSTWKVDNTSFEKTEYIFNRIQNHADFSDIFKKSSLEQCLKQAELDVVGNKTTKGTKGFGRNTIEYAVNSAALPTFERFFDVRDVLAKKINKQLVDQRLLLWERENGSGNPTIKILKRLAEGLGMNLKIEFTPKSQFVMG